MRENEGFGHSEQERETDRALRAAETGQIYLPPLDKASAGSKDRVPYEIWVLLGASFFVALGYGFIIPVLPQYAESFGVGAFLVAIVVSSFAFMRFVTAPFGGVLIDRLGERTVYVSGLLIVAVSSFASAFANNYTELLIFRSLGGVGSALFTLSASAIVVRYSPPRIRGRATSLWAGTFLLGSILGPVFGGFLGQLGMNVPFIGYGVMLTFSAGVITVLMRRRNRRKPSAEPEKLESFEFSQALAEPAYRTALSFAFANGLVNIGIRAAVIPLFVSQVVTSEPFAAGLVVAAAALGTVLLLPVSGRISDRVGRRPFIMTGLAVSAVATVTLVTSSELWFVLMMCFIAGAGSGLCTPVSQASVGDIIGPGRAPGRALSLYQMLQDLGQILGPLVAGIMIDSFGFVWAFVGSAIVLMIPFCAWGFTRDTLPR